MTTIGAPTVSARVLGAARSPDEARGLLRPAPAETAVEAVAMTVANLARLSMVHDEANAVRVVAAAIIGAGAAPWRQASPWL